MRTFSSQMTPANVVTGANSILTLIATVLGIISVIWIAIVTGLWLYNKSILVGDINNLDDRVDAINASIPEGNGTVFFDDEFTIANGPQPGRKFMFNASLVAMGTKRNYAFPNDDGIVLLDSTFEPVFPEDEFAVVGDVDPTTRLEFDLSLIPGSTLRLASWQNKHCTVACLDDINGGGGNATEFLDSQFAILNDPDTTKRAMFDASQIDPLTNRTYAFPNLNGTLTLTTGAQTLTDKIIDSTTNTVTADNLHSATTTIDVSSATAPVSGQVLTATSPTAATWVTPAVSTGNAFGAFINETRSFPDLSNEGVSTIGELNATAMQITVWGGGGGGGFGGFVLPTSQAGGGGGGSGGAVVNFPLDLFTLSLLSSETFTVVIGSGGAGGIFINATSFTLAESGGTSAVRTNTSGTIDIFLQAYGGGGGSSGTDFLGGGGAGSGGSASAENGGIANGVGGAAGPDGGLDNSGGSQVTLYWTGWGGGNGTADGFGPAQEGSNFFNRGVGGSVNGFGGGGAGGFAGKGADSVSLGVGGSAAANSGAGGAGGGAVTRNGGDGGSGGAFIIWWTQ